MVGFPQVQARTGRDTALAGLRVLLAHPAADLYGSDRVLLESVSALTERGAVVVLTVPERGPLLAAAEARGATVVLCPAPVLRKSALSPRGLLGLTAQAARGLRPALRLVRAAGAGVVLVNTVTVPSWLVLARLCGRRVVCHVHEAERSQPALLRRLMALPLRCADRIVVNSRFSRDVLLDVTPGLGPRSSVLYNGVVGPDVVSPARRELTGPVRLLFVGRLSPRKGPQVLLAVLAELAVRGIDAELELLGSTYPGYEWFERELRATVAATGRGSTVRFSGFDDDVWPHLTAADVVLVPSQLDEPFGNTAVEAVLAARPVVVSATCGLTEAVAGCPSAQLVEPTDVAGWADAIERVVRRWPEFRDGALVDSAGAGARFAPGRYRADLAAAVAALAGPR